MPSVSSSQSLESGPLHPSGAGERSEAGTALLMILLAMFAIGLMSMVVAQVASTELTIISNITAGTASFMPADGASQVLLRDLVNMARSLGRFPTDAELATISAPPFSSVNLTQFTAFADGPELAQSLSGGLYIGLSAQIQPFKILATATRDGPPASNATVEIDGEFASIPIFQFGALYEQDLEIFPGPSMTLGGRLHSNGDIYIGTGSTVSLNAPVTTNGKIYNFRKDDSTTPPGTVNILDSVGVYQAMAGLDSTDPNWSSQAMDRWDGRVRTGNLGGQRLDLVIEDPLNPHLVIEPGRPTDSAADQAAKIYYQAGLRILNGQGYDGSGTPVSLIDPLTSTSAVRETLIDDPRESKTMLTVEVDMAKLGRLSAYPVNGVVYVGAFEPTGGMPMWLGGSSGVGPAAWVGYDTPWSGTGTTEFAVKLANGQQLVSPLSVTTENPVYIHGNYNTVAKKGAAVMADAVTILSNAWGDLDYDGTFDEDLAYSQLPLTFRFATPTTVNAALMMGNTTTAVGGPYNGGLENLPRLIEYWAGGSLTLRGSFVDLWQSIYADSPYGAAGVYSAPIRSWLFDPDFLSLGNLPPASPRVYQIRVTGWHHR
ncbi:MAG: hypothetical protein ACE5HV_12245 [Acidobacteriota bacterium]